MKALLIIAVVACTTALPLDYSRYENFNIDEVMGNKRLMDGQVKCFLSTGPCTPENAEVKKTIPTALQDSCGECSLKQKILVARIAQVLMEKRPEDWEKLNKIHNPDGKFDENIKKFVEEFAHQKD